VDPSSECHAAQDVATAIRRHEGVTRDERDRRDLDVGRLGTRHDRNIGLAERGLR